MNIMEFLESATDKELCEKRIEIADKWYESNILQEANKADREILILSMNQQDSDLSFVEKNSDKLKDSYIKIGETFKVLDSYLNEIKFIDKEMERRLAIKFEKQLFELKTELQNKSRFG